MGKDFANKYFSGSKKDKFLDILEIIRLLEEGIPFLEKKVEFLATGVYNSEYSQDENNEITTEHFQNLIGIFPGDNRLQRVLPLALSIIDEQVDKKKALKNLRKIRSVLLTFLENFKTYMLKPPRFPSSLKSRISVMTQLSRMKKLNIKARDMVDKVISIVKEIMRYDEEYKLLLERKNSGEPVEDLIKKNRYSAEILRKKNKEYSEKALKWRQSKEGSSFFKHLEGTIRINPGFARNSRFRFVRGLDLSKKIKSNDEEFEKLLERKNKSEYVDDLINQNRRDAKTLAEQNKRVWKDS